MRDNVCVHAVSAREGVRHAGIVLFKGRHSQGGKERVLVAEETVAKFPVVVRHVVELVRLHLLEMRDRLLGDMEGGFAVPTPVEPRVPTHVQDLVFLREPERGVHANAR